MNSFHRDVTLRLRRIVFSVTVTTKPRPGHDRRLRRERITNHKAPERRELDGESFSAWKRTANSARSFRTIRTSVLGGCVTLTIRSEWFILHDTDRTVHANMAHPGPHRARMIPALPWICFELR
jgi:hypothetical protein